VPDLLDHNFLFVVGKGGVGKTTVSAAAGLAAARKGKRVLIAMANATERLSQLLGVDPIGDQVVQVAPNLDAVNMSPKAALEEYGMMILKVKSLYKAIFENRFVEAFLRGTPGIEAWAMLGKAYFHAAGHGPGGKGAYDLVLLDAPATGHGLDMIRVPHVILDVAPPGLLRREAERALSLFQDPKRAGALLVTLAEDMPVNESIELHTALVQDLKIHVPEIVVNQLLPKLFADDTRDAIAGIEATLSADSPLQTLARAGRLRTMREATQADSLKTLSAALDVPRRNLPRLFDPEFGRAAIESLSHAFG
jgi:hypothetical protein